MNINAYFEKLKISPDSTYEEAKAAYRQLAQVWHPDKHSHNEKLQAKATSKIKEINAAWSEIEAYFKDGTAREAESRVREESERFQKTKEEITTYTDEITGLMWTTNGNIAGKQMNWYDAINWVKDLNYGGYGDWRLPMLNDFVSLPGRGEMTILKANGFKNIQSGIYWTRSPYKDDDNYAGYFDMRGGLGTGIKTHEFFVLPVRGGRFKSDEIIEAEAREDERHAREWLKQTEQELPTHTNQQSSLLLRPLDQQSLGEKILRGLIAGSILIFILSKCS